MKHGIIVEARARSGNIRQKEQVDLLPRPHYGYGMLRAADLARYLGLDRVTACEFGVATGKGLLEMIALGDAIAAETGVTFRIVGFDTTQGLPEIGDYKDHPEMWCAGDFLMSNHDELVRQIEGKAELVVGDIRDTVSGLVEGISKNEPLGFLAIDVDIYTATCSALQCLCGQATKYLPAISMYFDDVGFFFANRWCGELRAIDEFNAAQSLRKIDRDRSLQHRKAAIPATWHEHMYVGHIFDHPMRAQPTKRDTMGLEDHIQFMRRFGLA